MSAGCSLPLLTLLCQAALAWMPGIVRAAEPPVAAVYVDARNEEEDVSGRAAAASEGTVSNLRLERRPMERPGELLETIPGVIVTQHSGGGKANQFFLRGFNLDHGTDFGASLSGVPLNFPSHAHGQGYLDLNFLIPELVDRIDYRKGPYRAQDGDFASAGSASIEYVRTLEHAFASVTLGQDGYRRALLAGSPKLGDGNLLYALEAFGNNGPWAMPENLGRLNGVLRWSTGTASDGWSVGAMSYKASWASTDQVPQRALDAGVIPRFGNLDSSDGGSTARTILSGEWAKSTGTTQTRAQVWHQRYRLNLYSNFTFFTDPVNGDQFEQAERRTATGFSGSHAITHYFNDLPSITTFGVQARQDRISPLGLYLTTARTRYTTVREDAVNQRSVGLYAENSFQWTKQWKTIVGLRHDRYAFRVDSDTAANSGSVRDQVTSPKLSVIYAPQERLEFYGNLGRGFHSNDARGTTARINPDPRDPGFLGPVDPVNPLVRTTGREIGLRIEPVAGWRSTLALWRLEAASELLFVGDAGTTEPSRPTMRRGIEWSNMWTPARNWIVDADIDLSRARFRDFDPAGDRVPGAIEKAASIGIAYHGADRYAEIRIRYFGPRPLIEDNSARSPASQIVNLRLGVKPERRVTLALDVLNLFNRKVSDIDYLYTSQLATEAVPVADRHTHPALPRSLRMTLVYAFD